MTFDFQPRLSGSLVALRPTTRDDFEALYAIASDPELWAQHPVPELCRREIFQPNIEDAFSDEGGLTVSEKRLDRIIGYSRYSQRFSGPSAVEIGWTFLDRTYWGGAYNGELKRLMLEHAFDAFPLVTFRAGENNWRSRRAMEKIGASPSGWRQDVEAFGRVAARVGYELSREDFLNGPLTRPADEIR